MLNIPEQAVRCFEKWSNTQVVIYDFSRDFLPVMSPMRNIHRYKVCNTIKTADCAKSCTHFDFWIIQREIWRHRTGCLKRCHANVLEWCIPVFSDNKLLCMLEAGLRKSLPDMDYPFPVISEPVTATINDSTLKFAEIEEVKHVMEGMRQLAARLQTWYEALHKQEPEYSKDQRHVQLHKLFQRNYRSKLNLAKVAKFMHLSPSRTAHVIKEITGKNFKDVLNEYRLRDACLQLMTTNLSISEIAHDIGYTDESNFYRAFKHYMKITPRQYRVTSREEQPYKA